MEKLKGNYSLCVHMADEFFNAAQSVYEGPISMAQGRLYPYAVNMAFACELYMKAIQMHFDENECFTKTHDLKIIFDELPEFEKEYIRLGYGDCHCTEPFDLFLNNHKNVFEEWRYIFQDGKSGKTFNYSGFQAFAFSLQESVKRINS